VLLAQYECWYIVWVELVVPAMASTSSATASSSSSSSSSGRISHPTQQQQQLQRASSTPVSVTAVGEPSTSNNAAKSNVKLSVTNKALTTSAKRYTAL